MPAVITLCVDRVRVALPPEAVVVASVLLLESNKVTAKDEVTAAPENVNVIERSSAL